MESRGISEKESIMIVEFFVLTLFLCPSNVKACTPAELIPAPKTYKFEQFKACQGTGQTLQDAGEVEGFKCHRHEGYK